MKKGKCRLGPSHIPAVCTHSGDAIGVGAGKIEVTFIYFFFNFGRGNDKVDVAPLIFDLTH